MIINESDRGPHFRSVKGSMRAHRTSEGDSSEQLVIGATITGLWAALQLARTGRRVRVIDKGPRRSNTADDTFFRGIPCDLGINRLPPAALEQPLFREVHRAMPFAFQPHRGVLLLSDRRIPIPQNPLAMVQAVGPIVGLSMGANWLARTAKSQADGLLRRLTDTADGERDIGLERFIIDRVGERAYHTFYRPYAEKMWGLPPAELSRSVAMRPLRLGQRARAPEGLVDRATSWIEGATGTHEQGAGFVFPAGGAASIVSYLETQLHALNVPIEHNRPFRAGEAKNTPALFAGALHELVETSLECRGQYLISLAFPCELGTRSETYYSSDPRHWFGRVSQVPSAPPSLTNAGEMVLCVEIAEGSWGTGVDFTQGNLHTALVEQLALAGIVPRGAKALGTKQRFVPNVYPVYRRGWRGEWHQAMRRVAALRSVLPIAPDALFLQGRIDQGALVADAAVRHVEAKRSIEHWIAQVAAS